MKPTRRSYRLGERGVHGVFFPSEPFVSKSFHDSCQQRRAVDVASSCWLGGLTSSTWCNKMLPST
ncbi:hypothetical protein IscW_ISCW023910, partial [Ixodes scapularis]